MGLNPTRDTHTPSSCRALLDSHVNSPGRRELPLVFVLCVTVDGDDADRRARRVGDDDGLRLVSDKGQGGLDKRGGRLDG